MKRTNKLSLAAVLTLAVLVLSSQAIFAQTCDSTGVGQGNRNLTFVDANGDGVNDNAPNHDGDGIPNGQDPDYVRTGTGRGQGFIDIDGDGINDNVQDFDGDGIPNGKDSDYTKPLDGSGRKMMRGSGTRGTASGMSGFIRGSGTGTCISGSSSSIRTVGGRRGR